MLGLVAFIIVGMILLIKGADFLVEGASNIAKKFHIPEIIIGLTIVSIGTSMPELFVSITSALEGYSDMAIGNVVGSNIANLMLILGISSLIRPIRFRRQTMFIEIPICIVTTLIFWIIGTINSDITRGEGIFLLVLFIMFIIYTIIMSGKGDKFNKEKEEDCEDSKIENKLATLIDLLAIGVGILALKFGGDLVVNNAVAIAEIFKWSEKLISITILAIGTSLPELVTSVSAAFKGKSDIALGNVIGSNIFNILLIIAVSAIIKPMTYNPSYNMDMIFLTIGSILLFIFPMIRPKCRISKGNAVLFILLYGIYITFSFFR